MKTAGTKRLLSVILCMVLLAAAVLTTAGCSGRKTADTLTTDAVSIGEGSRHFTLTVTDADGSSCAFAVSTDEETVAAALVKLGLVSGEDGPFGLYIKTVNGITADYDRDGTYWAFYTDGEYAMAGADMTPITDGAEYALRVEK